MATNLRLRADVAAAVKSEAARTGRSQQDIIRTAIEAYLARAGTPPTSAREANDSLGLIPPRSPWRRATKRIRLAPGVSSTELLGREDRI
ncbi:CopG family transcriptional regulator [Rathayibacter soli]|uniref:CopG family transcriptional regulator n=1 Tax=Rathayibacter soli TaxID=3144168 RepID=UPI0027E57085|nr:CopG family transcriptional regulator [Glaciibacter superstes]